MVYTPAILASFVARKAALHLSKKRRLSILDPACGNGELLRAAQDALPRVDKLLCGIDIDIAATQEARRRLATSRRDVVRIIKTNALYPFNRRTAKQGWKELLRRFGVAGGFDLIIANPPWGADVKGYAHKFTSSEYTLYRGQYDTSDLFIERACTLLSPRGVLAFIIPDSLFSLERRELRKKLTGLDIVMLARLGERIFPAVNRACAVVICQNKRKTPNATTVAFRLTPEHRKRILSGKETFEVAEKNLAHKVPQQRFAQNPGHLFDIDVREKDRMVYDKLMKSGTTFGDYCDSFRGVELSKRGRVCSCSACGKWMPLPEDAKCIHCRAKLGDAQTEVIIRAEPVRHSKRLLAGESIRRYGMNGHYWITLGKEGINYKNPSLYEGPKIVVRKTGVGISATIDYWGSYTNQVVYILKPKPGRLRYLELLLTFLNSRAMYYALAKRHGETEWRSHPYVTQRALLDLPLPTTQAMENAWQSRSSVLRRLRNGLQHRKGVVDELDAELESVVAEAFNLTRRDYNAVYNTLSDSEALLPIRALQRVNPQQFF